jgi:hypothetical protein
MGERRQKELPPGRYGFFGMVVDAGIVGPREQAGGVLVGTILETLPQAMAPGGLLHASVGGREVLASLALLVVHISPIFVVHQTRFRNGVVKS